LGHSVETNMNKCN